MSVTDDIFNYLEYISQQNRSVSLVYTYHGVSISIEADILKVSRRRDNITVATRHGQNISLLPATTIFVHSDLFPRPIQASVASVDVHHREAELRSLIYSPNPDDGRKETRVQPKEKLNARVALPGHPERVCQVIDISVEGISLWLIDRNIDLEQVFLPRTSVRLFVNLPASGQSRGASLSYRATVTYVNPGITKGEYRIGLMTYPSEEEKTILRRYIFDRQTELFNEVGQEPTESKGAAFTL
jgi:hypothetical protein